jgi:hypothetical protein
MAWIGTRELAVILANVQGFPTPPPTDQWKSEVKKRFFNDPSNPAPDFDFKSYINRVSYGKANLTGDVFGPYDVKKTDNLAHSVAEAIQKAYDEGLINGIRYACVIFTLGGAWAYWGNRTGTTDVFGSCYVDMPSLRTSVGIVAMENLHSIMEFGDLYGIPDQPYEFDVMACNCGTHPSSFTKIKFGWLDATEIAVILETVNDVTIELHALSNAIVPNSVHTIKIPSVKSKGYFLIETRLRTDAYERYTPSISSGIPNEGVVIYWIDESTWPPVHLVRPLLTSIGDKYINLQERIEVSIISNIPYGFKVRVKRNLQSLFSHQPTVVQNADGRLEAFIIGDDKQLYHRWQKQPNKAWHDRWESLGGIWS